MSRDDASGPGRRRRRLSEEEIDLWLSVAATVARRPGATLPEVHAKPKPVEHEAPHRPAPDLLAPVAPARPKPPPLAPLERKVRQKLSRGRMGADAAIDLHGFRQTEALSALRRFLHDAHRDGARIVLVVTGKGGRAADPFDMTGGGIGVLKRAVPLWLAQPEFRAIVLGFEDAARPHGGTGALYVRLRRRDRP